MQLKKAHPKTMTLKDWQTKLSANGRTLDDDCWKVLKSLLDAVDQDNYESFEKAYKTLLKWKRAKVSGATFRVLHDALCHDIVDRRDLAEKFCLVTRD